MDVLEQPSASSLTDDDKSFLTDFVDCFISSDLNSIARECVDLSLSDIYTKTSILLNEDVEFGNESQELIDLDRPGAEEFSSMSQSFAEIDVAAQFEENWAHFDSSWLPEELVVADSNVPALCATELDLCSLYDQIRTKFGLGNFEELLQYDFSSIQSDEVTARDQNGIVCLLPISSENLTDSAMKSIHEKLQKDLHLLSQLISKNVHCCSEEERSSIVLPFKPVNQVEAEPTLQEKLQMIERMEISVPLIEGRRERCRKKQYVNKLTKSERQNLLNITVEDSTAVENSTNLDKCNPRRKSQRIRQKTKKRSDAFC